MILDLTAVQAGTVTNRHIVADNAWLIVCYMETGKILHIRTLTDRDVRNVAACYDTRPDTRVLCNANIAGQEGFFCDKCLFINLRLDAMKCTALKRIHEKSS